MDFPYVFFFRIFASMACVIICIVEPKIPQRSDTISTPMGLHGQTKKRRQIAEMFPGRTHQALRLRNQEERRSGEKCQEIHQLLWMEQVVAAWVGKVDK